MSHNNSNLKSLLSPSRAGTFFAPFRSRSANPDGFDSKMKLWISAIEEWAVSNKKLTFSLKDIHQTFISDTGCRPDKECIRLVLSEMKRKSQLVPLTTLKTSNFWSYSSTQAALDNYVDPKGWLSWGVKTLVVSPASWAMLALTKGQNTVYSDLTDMSITDTMKFVSQKSLSELSQNLLSELVRICKAEKQFSFEWDHLLELLTPILNTIVDASDGKELLEMLNILIDYLAVNKHVATLVDSNSKLIKVANPEDSSDDDVQISKKDVAMARLLKAKELLTADADKYHNQALRAKQDALSCYSRKEVAKAKSLLRSHKRLGICAEQKEAQLTNVEIMLDQLENTDSNMVILKAYKDGADALKIANTHMEANTSILDEMYDATAEARYLNDEMNQMLKDISCLSQGMHDITSNAELEDELNEYIAANEEQHKPPSNELPPTQSGANESTSDAKMNDKMLEELGLKLDSLVVCQDSIDQSINTSSPVKNARAASTAT